MHHELPVDEQKCRKFLDIQYWLIDQKNLNRLSVFLLVFFVITQCAIEKITGVLNYPQDVRKPMMKISLHKDIFVCPQLV
jgi:hypothetical protein